MQTLEYEGRKQEHCVASYTYECLMAGSFIYSIRSKEHNILSTFEVKFTNNKPEIIQHKAYENNDPSNDEIKTAKLFVKSILSSISVEQLQAVMNKRYEIGKSLQGRLPKVNTLEDELSPNELAKLADIVEFTHPEKAKEIGILKYYKQYVIT